MGRFITQDPIGLFGGDNLYRYVENPIRWIDVLGLASSNPGVYDVFFEALGWPRQIDCFAPSQIATLAENKLDSARGVAVRLCLLDIRLL